MSSCGSRGGEHGCEACQHLPGANCGLDRSPAGGLIVGFANGAVERVWGCPGREHAHSGLLAPRGSWRQRPAVARAGRPPAGLHHPLLITPSGADLGGHGQRPQGVPDDSAGQHGQLGAMLPQHCGRRPLPRVGLRRRELGSVRQAGRRVAVSRGRNCGLAAFREQGGVRETRVSSLLNVASRSLRPASLAGPCMGPLEPPLSRSTPCAELQQC